MELELWPYTVAISLSTDNNYHITTLPEVGDETIYFAVEDGQTTFSFSILACEQRELQLRNTSTSPPSYEIIIGADNNANTVSKVYDVMLSRNVILESCQSVYHLNKEKLLE